MEDSRVLILSRRAAERIYLGDDIVLTIVAVGADKVRIGVKAPEGVRILRTELDTGLVAAEPDSECCHEEHIVATLPFSIGELLTEVPTNEASHPLADGDHNPSVSGQRSVNTTSSGLSAFMKTRRAA